MARRSGGSGSSAVRVCANLPLTAPSWVTLVHTGTALDAVDADFTALTYGDIRSDQGQNVASESGLKMLLRSRKTPLPVAQVMVTRQVAAQGNRCTVFV